MGLRHVGASRAGIFINLEPVVGAICGVVFFTDGVTWQLLLGATLVLAAAASITLPRAETQSQDFEPARAA